MYYPSAKFGDDISSGFCFRVLTYTYIHTYTHTRTEWINALLKIINKIINKKQTC